METAIAEPKRLRDLKSGVRDLIMLDPSIIKIEEGHNPRDYTLAENREHLESLKSSIRQHGVRSPLWVRWDSGTKQAILVDGECRLRATLELIAEGVEIVSVPTVQVEAGNEASRLVLAITANTGKPLSKWEDGAAFRRLHNFGWEAEKIAEQTGHKVRYIREAMELADAPQEVKAMLSEGTVTPAIALKTTREHGDNAGEVLKGKVEEAKAKAKPKANGEASTKVTVKRERKASGKSFAEQDAASIKAALEAAYDDLEKWKQDDLTGASVHLYPETLDKISAALELFA